MRKGFVVCILLLGAVATLANGAFNFEKTFPAAPLSEQVFRSTPAEDDPSISISNTVPPPPSVKRDVILWDDKTMPHPDVTAKMSEGPDVVFRPPLHNEAIMEETNVHTTHRNMVMPGLDMIRVDKNPDITQSPSLATIKSVTDKLEELYHSDMPLSPDLGIGPECADPAAVAEIGTAPSFSETPLIPTQEAFGTRVGSNSYKDFISGLPRDVAGSVHEGVIKTPPPAVDADEQLNPKPFVNVTVTEGHVDMAFKFTAKLKFMCEKDISKDFDTRYGKILREVTSLGAHVPLGNVEIDKTMDGDGIVSLDIGAPTVQAMREEITDLKNYIKEGTFKEALKLKGFANCASSIVSIADNLQAADVAVMPEASAQDQLGPPGGKEDDPLTPEEQRERARTREAMTYGEYSTVGRLNITRLQPHIYHNISLPPAPKQFNVVGRFKFIFQSEHHIKLFPVIYSELVHRAIAYAAKLPVGTVQIQISGSFPPLSLHRSASVAIQTNELPNVLLDFDIPADNLIIARALVSSIVKSMSSSKGMRNFLSSTGNFPEDGEMILLFIEIHSPDGSIIDDDDDSCTDDDGVVDEEIDVQPSPVPVSNKDMSSPPNCTDTPLVIHATEDESVKYHDPAPSKNEWSVMSSNVGDKAHMNRPGVDGRDPPEPLSLLVQVEQPQVPKPVIRSRHFQALEPMELVQIEIPDQKKSDSMRDQIASSLKEHEAALISEDVQSSNGMPEAEENMNAPAGGFPVADSDSGAL